MLNKNFLQTDVGKKHVIAYALHIHYGICYKDIAEYYGCASTTIGYLVRNLKKYRYLKDFMYIMKLYESDIQMILKVIQNPKGEN